MDKKTTFRNISENIGQQVGELLDYIATHMRGKTITIDYLAGDEGSWTGVRDFLEDENLMINIEYDEGFMEDNSVVITVYRLANDEKQSWDLSLFVNEDDELSHRIPSAILKGLTLAAKMKESMTVTL